MTPFVVTGCAMSGTLWASRVLSRLGIPCSHEAAFPWRLDRPRRPLAAGDSSWCAVPHVAGLEVPVVRLVRRPIDVVRSILRTGFLRPEDPHPATRYVAHHRPDLLAGRSHLERAVAFVDSWDRDLAADVTVRAEDGPWAVLDVARLVGVDLATDLVVRVCSEVGMRVHHHAGPDPGIGWADVPTLSDRAQALGYQAAA